MSELIDIQAAALASGQRSGAGLAASVESRQSWVAAIIVLFLLSISYGAPLLAVVGLKPITQDLATPRQLVALAGSLTWLGTGLGGILMGQVAERLGIRVTVGFGAAMMAAGLAVSAIGNIWALLIGHAVLLGFLGNSAFLSPLLVYISRWFDRRRGTALALVSSGQYIAGMAWPIVFERVMDAHGWRTAMLGFAGVVIIAVPLAALFLKPVPPASEPLEFAEAGARREVLGLHPNTVLAVIALAGFCCCIPMAIPQGHLVAFCSDVGIAAAQGAAMLSVMQASAFIARMFWGWLTDRIGGLQAVMAGSVCQALAIAAFMTTQDEAGLFAIAAAYGAGFAGIVPAYVAAIRDLYPSREAAWRVPSVLFVSMGGMAVGTWWAGALYDYFGFYAPAFASGIIFNVANLVLIGFLVTRQRRAGGFRRPALA